MYRRAFAILILFAAAALACAGSVGEELPAQATPAAEQAAATPVQTGEPTGNEIFLPDISSETTPGAQNQPAPSEPASAENLAAPTQNTFYLPDISSAGTPGAGAEAAQGPEVEEPYVEIQLDRTELNVGETVTITGRPVNIGMPYYYLTVKDEGVEEALPLVEVTFENQTTAQDGSSLVLELVSAEAGLDQATFVLRGKAPGRAEVSINATGEVQEGGGMTWSGGGSEAAVITIR